MISPAATPANFTIVAGGPAVTVSVASAGNASTASFAGTAGQRVSLNITNVTITSSKVFFHKPDGTNLVSGFTVTRSGYFLDVKTLPVTGTYKIVVDPKDTYTGSMKLRLYDVPADFTGSITADGTPSTVTTTVPGQNARLTFNGTAGQRVSLDLNSVTYASGKLKIQNPDATLLFPSALSFGLGGRFMEPQTLPATGTYTIVIDPSITATGTATAQLWTVPVDPSSPITACTGFPCTPTTVATTAPGQNAYLTFTGTAGQRISLLAGNSFYGGLTKVSVLKPDLSSLYSPALSAGGTDAFQDVQTLPASGSYQILVDPQGADVGSLDIQLYTVPADQTGPITPGTPLTATTTMPGQNGLYTFSGVANQRVSVNLANVTYDAAKVSILKPDQTQLAPPLYVPNTLGSFLEPVKLPVTGTYTVKVDPQGPATGSIDVGLYLVANDATGALTANSPRTVLITSPGQNATLTYSGTNGQRIFVQVTNVALGDSDCCAAKLQILRPDGTSLQTSKTFGNLGTYIDTKALTQNGTYKVKIDPIDEVTGNLDVTLYLVPADAAVTSAALTPNGTSANVTTTAPGQSGRVSFAGTAATRLAFKLVSFGSGFCPVKISVLRPDGTTFTAPTCSPDGNWFDTKALGVTGTFKIVVDPQGTLTGTASLVLYSVPADLVTTLGSSSSVTLTPGQNAFLSFSGTSGKTATVTPQTGGTIELARASLVKSDKKSQVGGAEYWDPATGGNPVVGTLPTTSGVATYYLEYDPIGGASGTSMTFGLALS